MKISVPNFGSILQCMCTLIIQVMKTFQYILNFRFFLSKIPKMALFSWNRPIVCEIDYGIKKKEQNVGNYGMYKSSSINVD